MRVLTKAYKSLKSNFEFELDHTNSHKKFQCEHNIIKCFKICPRCVCALQIHIQGGSSGDTLSTSALTAVFLMIQYSTEITNQNETIKQAINIIQTSTDTEFCHLTSHKFYMVPCI
jgi:hypothetical protein